MKRATVRDLRYRFREIEASLSKGEEIEVYKRRKMIGRLVPVQVEKGKYPDFEALSRSIFGNRKTRKTGAQMMEEERGRY